MNTDTIEWHEAKEYTPLLVTPKPSNRRTGAMVAFIGNQLCFFDNKSIMPLPDVEIEVMLLRPLYGTDPETNVRMRDNIRAVIVKPVDHATHVLAKVDGFECIGTMCRTTAYSKQFGMHTPGMTDVWVAENVNARFDGRSPTPKRPMFVWVRRKDPQRIEGLTRFDDASYFPFLKR